MSETQAKTFFHTWPDLTYWYRLSYDDLMDMPHIVRMIYERALPRLLAQQQVRDLDVSAFPHLKRDAQNRITERINKDLHEGQREWHPPEPPRHTKEQAVAMMQQLGVGFTEVSGDA